MPLVGCRHSVTWPDSLRWISVEPLGPGLVQLPGFQPGREVPDDHCRPSTALAAIQPAFTDAERLALAGYLAGYRGLTREAYALAAPRGALLYSRFSREEFGGDSWV